MNPSIATIHYHELFGKMLQPGDDPEVGQRFFAALRMTTGGSVILSAAKNLSRAFDQQTRLLSPEFLGHHQVTT
ncbi:MAG: hypothetical protein ABI465_19815 [Ktedonobacteraceae bacterium]